MSDITLIDDSEQSSLVTNGLAVNGELYLKKAGSTDAGSIVVYDSGAWKTFANEYSAGLSNNYSVDFDGTNDYMGVTTTSSMSLYGVSAWVYLESTLSSAGIQGVVFGNSGTQWILGLGGNFTSTLTDEIISINLGARYGYSSSSDTVAAGWHHMAIAWSTSSTTNSGSNGYDIYLDGVNVGNQVNTTYGAATLYTLPVTSLRFGQRGDGAFPFGGKLDELALFNSSLSASDITAIYNSGVPSDISSLNPVHWWRMGDDDGGTGTTITDQGSAGNDGTLTNGPTFSSDVPS